MAENALTNLAMTTQTLSFTFELTDTPNYQWWAVFDGAMPSKENAGNYMHWDWFTNFSKTAKTGRINYNKAGTFKTHGLYTLAMYLEGKEYILADFQVVRCA